MECTDQGGKGASDIDLGVADICIGATDISRHDDRFGEQATGLSLCSLKQSTEDKGTRKPSGCVHRPDGTRVTWALGIC